MGRSSILTMKTDSLTTAMDTGMATIAAASADTLEAVAAFDEQSLWESDGASSMTSWLAARYGLARGTAREWVRVAHALRELPAIAEAFARGRLSWDQLRPLTRFAAPESDEDLSLRAPGLSPADLWVEARRHERVSARQAENAHLRRYLAMWWDPEKPLLYLNGMFPGEQGAAVEAALCQRIEQLPSDPDAASPTEARFADALADLVTTSLSGSQPATVVVHADADVLAGDEARHGPLCRRPSRASAWPRRRSAGWPAMDGSSGWWCPPAVPSGSGGAAGPFPGRSPGCCGTATGPAVSPAARRSAGSTPTTWFTGRMAEPPTWTTWCSCAAGITA